MGILIDNVVGGIFLFILIGFSNYIYLIIPNQLEKFILGNLWFQHLLIFFLINFSVELVDNSYQSPLNNFYNSIVIYIFYILFSKCSTLLSLVIIFLLAAIFIMVSEKEYQGEGGKYLETPIRTLTYIICGLIGISTLWTLWTKYYTNPHFNLFKYYLNIDDNPTQLPVNSNI